MTRNQHQPFWTINKASVFIEAIELANDRDRRHRNEAHKRAFYGSNSSTRSSVLNLLALFKASVLTPGWKPATIVLAMVVLGITSLGHH